MTISERIKEVRGSLSRREFGETLGISGAVIQNIEDAENRLKGGVPEHILKLICATYNVRYEWLKNGDGEKYLIETPTQKADRLIAEHAPEESEFAKAIIRAFITMPDSEWVRLRNMIETIKKEGAE